MEPTASSESNSDTRSAQQRPRACVPCTRAKRRCDKDRPSCRRCSDRELQCRYSSSRPYARRSGRSSNTWRVVTSESSRDLPSPALQDDNEDDCEGEDEHIDTDLGPQCSNCLWFLRIEHWVIYHRPLHPPPVFRSSIVHQYIHCIRKWLNQWIEFKHCPMIHRSLFTDTGMLPCLQDAYATLAVYSLKNEHNENVVMQHVEDKANALLKENAMDDETLADPFPSSSPLSTPQHLARVLALFIYQFIRLFDGHIRQRALAEKEIPLLKCWTTQLWNSVSLDVTVQNTFGGEYLTIQDKTDAAIKLWHSWILIENVRRIWMVSTYASGIYLMSRDGTAYCGGTIDFTARRGLWDAVSASVWVRMLKGKDPLFVVPFQAAGLLESTVVDDIDIFGLATMALTLDSDKLDSWIAKSTTLRLEEVLMAD